MTPWTAAYQAPPSMGLYRQEYWSGLPLPSLIDNILGHKRSLNKLKRIEVISISFSDHNSTRTETTERETGKHDDMKNNQHVNKKPNG